MIHTLLIAATIAATHPVTLEWDPPTIWDPPAMEWEDRCERPTNAVPVEVATPVQYRLALTNSTGHAQEWIVAASPATIEVPQYLDPATHTITVTALYEDEPHESEPSCALVYITPPHRPAPTGLRIVAAETTVASGLPPVAMTLAWRAQDAFVPDQIDTSPGPVPEMPQ